MNITLGRIIDILFALAFMACAWVQTNDPDSARWIAIYLAAAGVALWPRPERWVRVVAALLGVVVTLWCVVVLPEASMVTRPGDIIASMSPDRPQTEAARELGGLLFILFFCLQRTLRRYGPPVPKKPGG